METDGAVEEERDLANYLSPFSLAALDFLLFCSHLDQDVHLPPEHLNASTRLKAPCTAHLYSVKTGSRRHLGILGNVCVGDIKSKESGKIMKSEEKVDHT